MQNAINGTGEEDLVGGEFAEIEIAELELREDLALSLFSCCPCLPCSPGYVGT